MFNTNEAWKVVKCKLSIVLFESGVPSRIPLFIPWSRKYFGWVFSFHDIFLFDTRNVLDMPWPLFTIELYIHSLENEPWWGWLPVSLPFAVLKVIGWCQSSCNMIYIFYGITRWVLHWITLLKVINCFVTFQDCNLTEL